MELKIQYAFENLKYLYIQTSVMLLKSWSWHHSIVGGTSEAYLILPALPYTGHISVGGKCNFALCSETICVMMG